MKNLPKRREIDSALTRRFTCVSATGAPCVRACLGCACGGRPGSTNSRRNARVYHAATAGDAARTTTRSGAVPTAAERRRRGEVVELGDATKAALCRGSLERSLDRQLAAHRSFCRSRRGVRIRRPRRHDNERNDKNATARAAALAARARETHSSLHPSPGPRAPAATKMLV